MRWLDRTRPASIKPGMPRGLKPSTRELQQLADGVKSHLDELSPDLREIASFIAANIGQRVTLKAMEKTFKRPRAALTLAFERATGLTIREYALCTRMAHAAREIERGVKIEAVALLVGYRSRKNFYRQFKSWFGMTPASYREASRSQSPPSSKAGETEKSRMAVRVAKPTGSSV